MKLFQTGYKKTENNQTQEERRIAKGRSRHPISFFHYVENAIFCSYFGVSELILLIEILYISIGIDGREHFAEISRKKFKKSTM